MAKQKTKQNKTKNKPSKKQYSLTEKILGLVELGRPVEWSKSLLNMFIALLMAFYIYQVSVELTTFIVGFFAVALLWSGLYALNDYTDWKIDSLHERKKSRPIPSGKISPKQGLAFSLILLIISFGISFALGNFLLLMCLLIMLTNQLLYTTKPWRLKSRKFFDVISGSMVNPFFRYFSGIVLFVPAFALFAEVTPLLPIIFVVGIQFSGYSLYRLFSKSHDTKLKMKSSVALLPEKLVKKIAYFVMLIAGLSYLGLLFNGTFFRIDFLGWLPVQYFGAIIIVLLFAPFLKGAIKKPQNADMKSSYRLLYGMNVVFVIANAIIFLLFP